MSYVSLRLQRNFLWGGAADQNKIPWIKWEKVCKPKELGGLGVKDIISFNTSLLGKWKWEMKTILSAPFMTSSEAGN